MKNLGYNANAHIGFGRAAPSIAKIVIDDKIDFIVMGSRYHKVFKDLYLRHYGWDSLFAIR